MRKTNVAINGNGFGIGEEAVSKSLLELQNFNF